MTTSQIARAIEQISDKPPKVDIDFTQHRLEDGNIVSTQERVIKDVRRRCRLSSLSVVSSSTDYALLLPPYLSSSLHRPYSVLIPAVVTRPPSLSPSSWSSPLPPTVTAPGPSPGHVQADRRAVLRRPRQRPVQARHRLPQEPLLPRGQADGGPGDVHHREGDGDPEERAECVERRCAYYRFVPSFGLFFVCVWPRVSMLPVPVQSVC
jgi:hypothetical protein